MPSIRCWRLTTIVFSGAVFRSFLNDFENDWCPGPLNCARNTLKNFKLGAFNIDFDEAKPFVTESCPATQNRVAGFAKHSAFCCVGAQKAYFWCDSRHNVIGIVRDQSDQVLLVGNGGWQNHIVF